MSLVNTIEDDLSKALKDRNEIVISSLRLFKSVLKNVEIEKKKELTDEEVTELIARQVKKHKEALDEFTRGDRSDLADREKEQLAVLEKYLPEQLSDNELKKIVEEVIKEKNATLKKQFGLVMGEVMKKAKGQADGNRVKAVVEELLQDIEEQ